LYRGYKLVTRETDFDGQLKTIVDCRLYFPGSVCYCALWIRDKQHSQGTGLANGCGYHKPSAAVEDAIINAGYKLDKSIDGAGDGALKDGLLAIARTITKKKVFVIEFFG
jgi:hypothetical protein